MTRDLCVPDCTHWTRASVGVRPSRTIQSIITILLRIFCFHLQGSGFGQRATVASNSANTLKLLITRLYHTTLYLRSETVSQNYDFKMRELYFPPLITTWQQPAPALTYKKHKPQGKRAVTGKPLVDSGSHQSCSYVMPAFHRMMHISNHNEQISKLGWKIPLQHI